MVHHSPNDAQSPLQRAYPACETPTTDTGELTPSRCLQLMFERTKGDGMLNISELPYGGCFEDEEFCECKMNWDEHDLITVTEKCEELLADLSEIAVDFNGYTDSYEKNEACFGKRLADVWDAYVRDFETGGSDKELINEVSASDDDLFDEYDEAVSFEAAKRIGGFVAYDVISLAQRLCRTMSAMNFESDVRKEACLLAMAVAVNDYAAFMYSE